MLITIEGCVGAGKTTVAQGLARLRGSAVLLEDYESNPFLKPFYKNPEENALEVEFTFLLLHSHQLKTVASIVGSRSSEVVADFHLWKDLIYADLNLADRRTLGVFKELHTILSERTAMPSLMILLSASTELILERIARRSREYEQRVNSEYFAKLNDAYKRAFEQHQGQKICVSMDSWDFVKDTSRFHELSLLVDRKLKA
jgi:deoxyadenosine/deoxycytidine kinase